jgi:hypothetical protein
MSIAALFKTFATAMAAALARWVGDGATAPGRLAAQLSK